MFQAITFEMMTKIKFSANFHLGRILANLNALAFDRFKKLFVNAQGLKRKYLKEL
jgi:hypothetical protein